MLIKPSFDLKKIRFATDEATYRRAVDLYESGKVTKVEVFGGHYNAVVLGTTPYRVSVSARSYKQGHCTCYLGARGTLCKHMISLAIHAVQDGKPINEEYKEPPGELRCGVKGPPLTEEKLEQVKRDIAEGQKLIKSYNGDSYKWFAYQNSLSEGCNILSAVVNELQVNKQSAEILVKLLLRLDKKLQSAVDDSDGTVGGFMLGVVEILEEYARLDPSCISAFRHLTGIESTFQWEEPLVRILDEGIPEKKQDEVMKSIDKKTARLIENRIFEDAPGLMEAAAMYGLNFNDMIRFKTVADMCVLSRKQKKLTVKTAAAALRVPQYRLKAIEKSKLNYIKRDILERYVYYLGLKQEFDLWKKENKDVYKNL